MQEKSKYVTTFLTALFLGAMLLFQRFGTLEPTAPVITPVTAHLPESVSRIPFVSALPISEPAFPTEPERIEGIADVVLDVSAAYAVTEHGEVLFNQNADEVIPIASITKVLTALAAVEQMPLDTPIVITPEAIRTEGNLGGLYVNETFSLHDALIAMLLPSSNDAAVAIAQASGGVEQFVAAMNEKAKAFGATNSNFSNVHGLSPPGNFASAADVATFMHEALRNDDLAAILRQPEADVVSEDGIAHTFVHRGNGLTAFPGVLGLKTGYTDESRGTLVFAFRPDARSDRIVVTVILGSDDRSADTEALAQWVRGAYRWPIAETIIAKQ